MLVAIALGIVWGCDQQAPVAAGPAPTSATSVSGAAGGVGAAGAPAAGAAGAAHGGADDGPGSPASCARARPGPAMVSVSTPDGHRYCIDTTEVTQAHYALFRDKVDLATITLPQPTCDYFTFLAPPKPLSTPEEHTCVTTYHPDKTPDSPMVCVDWCSAYAYCAWAGKRLCGQVGGGMIVENKLDNANTDEWYNACTNGGKTVYPYGNALDAAACHAETPLEGQYPAYPPVAQRSGCRGVEPPYDAIFDMSMGAAEWQDGCWPAGTSGSIYCPIRGGKYDTRGDRTSCRHSTGSGPAAYPTVGFRCCADLSTQAWRPPTAPSSSVWARPCPSAWAAPRRRALLALAACCREWP